MSEFIQYIVDCSTHENCTAICCETTSDMHDDEGALLHDAGTVLWVSHMSADVDPEPRLNMELEAEDHRGHEVEDFKRPNRKPRGRLKWDVPYKPEALAAFEIDDEGVAIMAAHAVDLGVRTVSEVATKSGLKPSQIERHRRKK